jgi:hypothetical protein
VSPDRRIEGSELAAGSPWIADETVFIASRNLLETNRDVNCVRSKGGLP